VFLISEPCAQRTDWMCMVVGLTIHAVAHNFRGRVSGYTRGLVGGWWVGCMSKLRWDHLKTGNPCINRGLAATDEAIEGYVEMGWYQRKPLPTKERAKAPWEV
jgi:hypothetical protein